MLHQFTYTLFKLKLIQPSENTIIYWVNAMNDKIQNVCVAALNALEALGCNDDLFLLQENASIG